MFMTSDFAGVRLLLCGLLLLGSLALWRRPRALLACLLLGAVNLLAYAAYMAPLQRPYALDTFSDRTFNAGMAASAAAGNSPLEHTQVGMASLEPFWNVTIAALSATGILIGSGDLDLGGGRVLGFLLAGLAPAAIIAGITRQARRDQAITLRHLVELEMSKDEIAKAAAEAKAFKLGG